MNGNDKKRCLISFGLGCVQIDHTYSNLLFNYSQLLIKYPITQQVWDKVRGQSVNLNSVQL